MEDEVKEECAVAGVSLQNDLRSHPEGGAAYYLYEMLLQMQNRGQLAAGITTYNQNRMHVIDTRKKIGTVSELFATSIKPKAQAIMRKYSGTKGIGHTRYSTSGGDDEESAQPFESRSSKKWKWFSFSFNGNIANYPELKKEMESKGYRLKMNLDTEVILYYLAKAQEKDKGADLGDVFAGLSEKFDGAYNIAYMDAQGRMAVMRDPMGIRPMTYAIDVGFAAAASETVALANFVSNEPLSLKPGEMLISENGNVEVKRYAKSAKNAHCMFEYVYFASAASTLDGKSVYETRWKLGVELAKQESLKVNDRDFVVVPVPDTAKPAADGYAQTIGIPAMEGLIRNRWHFGRTFIESGDRMSMMKQKFNINTVALKNKEVILVDDSIVRGTTSKFLVDYLREKGNVKKIHMRVTCPPIRSPCFYGIDMSTVGELIANRHSNPEQLQRTGWSDLDDDVIEKIAQEIGVDSLRYINLNGLEKAIGFENGRKDMCTACITGIYPTACGSALREKALKNYESKTEANRTYA